MTINNSSLLRKPCAACILIVLLFDKHRTEMKKNPLVAYLRTTAATRLHNIVSCYWNAILSTWAEHVIFLSFDCRSNEPSRKNVQHSIKRNNSYLHICKHIKCESVRLKIQMNVVCVYALIRHVQHTADTWTCNICLFFVFSENVGDIIAVVTNVTQTNCSMSEWHLLLNGVSFNFDFNLGKRL